MATGDTQDDLPQVGTESSLASYAGDYVTDILGKGAAEVDAGYEAYEGPLTAGESDLQTKAFEGLGGLTIPTEGMSAFTGSMADPASVSAYMNPYLQGVLDPQIKELRRQADISRLADASRLTGAGAFGGSRQAIMESEGRRNLLDQIDKTLQEGYYTAYDKAREGMEFDRTTQDKDRAYGLSTLAQQLEAGKTEREIDAEGIKADLKQFEEERDFPYKAIQYLQSLLQGLPLETKSYTFAEPTFLEGLAGDTGDVMTLYDLLFGDEGLFPAGDTTKPKDSAGS
tara:strand:- start:398 stop:1249 length:852 start_codon:yes stop_codon:yes gene_type:complete